MKIMALTVALAATPAWADSHPPKEPIPETSYQSAFADYKPFQDETLHDWRQVNGDDYYRRRAGTVSAMER